MNLDVKSSSNGTSLPTSPARRDVPCGAAEHSDLLQKIYVRATVDSAWSMIIDGQCISSMWANAHMQQEMLACDGMLTKLISLSRIQQHIEQETHVPVTLEMLLRAGARRTGFRPQPADRLGRVRPGMMALLHAGGRALGAAKRELRVDNGQNTCLCAPYSYVRLHF